MSTVIESLVTYPERFPLVHRQTRRVNLRRFPTLVRPFNSVYLSFRVHCVLSGRSLLW
jgi:hypothetical protein